MAFSSTIQKLRYRLLPDHVIGEILSKNWIDSAIPVMALIFISIVFGALIPGFFSASSLSDLARQVAEFGLVSLGLTIVILSGGIDLSVGSVFAICVLTTLVLMNAMGVPVWAALLADLAVGIFCGLINGVLIGYLRLRAFITTLVTLVVFRSLYNLVFPKVADSIVGSMPASDLWDFIGVGDIYGIPPSFLIAAVIAVGWHIALSRTRPGWRLLAVGGARRSAHNAGINIRRTVCLAYVWSGVLVSIAAFLFAARLGSTGFDTGIGLEISALTAVILGGNSLGGGRGSVTRAMFGAVFILILTNSLMRLSVPGSVNLMVLGTVLLAAVFIDMKWLKNKGRVLRRVYVSPTYLDLPECPRTEIGSANAYEQNSRLRAAQQIGLGEIEAPEDVILDRDDNLYCGSRHGDIIRFFAPDYTRHEIFAHIGGQPLGLAMDAAGNLVTCVGGMGVYRISPAGVVERLTDETNRSKLSIIDDSRLKLPDDLDIAPDGRIFFSEGTTRYELSSWVLDALEGRGNGRIICYDPKRGVTRTKVSNLIFSNGVCICPDGQSLLFAETWGCRIRRYWFDGPKSGRVETVISGLPGYPDNINRASDGNYWVALLGMRTDTFDLAMKMPGLRKRMVRRVAPDEWLFPNINTGCVIKISESGKVLQSLWDITGVNHPMITSMREHKGYLYLGGISNNRIGRYKLNGADPEWTAYASYWGGAA